MYLYKKTIYRGYGNIVGLSDAQKTQNDADLSDFDTNHKTAATKVDEIIIAETTVITDLSYSQFEGKIDGVNILWSDVKFLQNADRYELNLISETEL